MSPHCLEAIFDSQLPSQPNCLLKCLPNCLSPTREGFFSSFRINPAVRVIARQARDKNCLAAIFAPRHQSVSSGPLGKNVLRFFLTWWTFRKFFFSARGRGRGSPRRQEGAGVGFLLKIPAGGGGGSPKKGEGGRGREGVCGEFWGGDLNIFFRGRNAHQVKKEALEGQKEPYKSK